MLLIKLFIDSRDGSTIKYDHSDSVIAYYTRWYKAHSVPTSYLRLSLYHMS